MYSRNCSTEYRRAPSKAYVCRDRYSNTYGTVQYKNRTTCTYNLRVGFCKDRDFLDPSTCLRCLLSYVAPTCYPGTHFCWYHVNPLVWPVRHPNQHFSSFSIPLLRKLYSHVLDTYRNGRRMVDMVEFGGCPVKIGSYLRSILFSRRLDIWCTFLIYRTQIMKLR